MQRALLLSSLSPLGFFLIHEGDHLFPVMEKEKA